SPADPAAAPGRPEPETGHTTAPDGGQGGDGTAPDGRPAHRESTRPAPSYAAVRSGADVDPDPVPTHESPTADSDPSPPLVLPRRRRGRTLAEAERARTGTGPAADRPAPTAEETRARTARFSSFRQAVRAPTADDT